MGNCLKKIGNPVKRACLYGSIGAAYGAAAVAACSSFGIGTAAVGAVAAFTGLAPLVAGAAVGAAVMAGMGALSGNLGKFFAWGIPVAAGMGAGAVYAATYGEDAWLALPIAFCIGSKMLVLVEPKPDSPFTAGVAQAIKQKRQELIKSIRELTPNCEKCARGRHGCSLMAMQKGL